MTSKKSDHYQQYLSRMHTKLTTPEEVIREVVKEGTGKELVSKDKIVAGEVNEVYDIALANGQRVILRISRNEYPNFQQERWANELCKKVGVPVADILLIKYVTIDNEYRSMCLVEKLAGQPLERGGMDFNALDLAVRKDLIAQAGGILSKIHSIETAGFGWIVGGGKTEYETSDQLIDRAMQQQEHLEKIVVDEGLDTAYITRAVAIIESFRGAYSKVNPRLNHGDYGPKHLLVSDNRVVGVLDFGGVRSDTPVYDFANWDYWFGDYIPTEWLKHGYLDKPFFDSRFNDILHMLRLFRGLEILAWYHQEKYKPAVERAKEKLMQDLEYFES